MHGVETKPCLLPVRVHRARAGAGVGGGVKAIVSHVQT